MGAMAKWGWRLRVINACSDVAARASVRKAKRLWSLVGALAGTGESCGCRWGKTPATFVIAEGGCG
jgi:hypothetical protein